MLDLRLLPLYWVLALVVFCWTAWVELRRPARNDHDPLILPQR